MLFSVLFFISSSFASSIDYMISDLSELNLRNKSEAKQKECGNSGIETPNDVYQCALDLCGVPSEVPSVQITKSNFDSFAGAEAKKQLKSITPQIKRYVGFNQKQNDNFISALNEKIKENNGNFDVNNLSQYFYDNIAKDEFQSNYILEIDNSKPIKERLNVILKDTDSLSKEKKEALEEYAGLVEKTNREDLSFAISMDAYSLEESKSLVKSEITALDKKFRDLLQKYPEFFRGEDERIQKFLDSFNIESFKDNAELSDGISELDNYKSILYEVETGEWPEDKRSFCSGDKCLKFFKNKLKSTDWNKLVGSIDKANKDPRILEGQIDLCKSQLGEAFRAEYDNNRLKDEFESVKGPLLNKALKFLSAESKKQIEDYLNNDLELASFEDKPSRFNERFKESIESLDVLEKYAQDYSEFSSEELIEELAYRTTNGELNAARTIPACNFLGHALWDYFQGNGGEKEKGLINTSIFSNLHIHYGKSILAHELGHAVNSQILSASLESYLSFTEVRDCISKSHVGAKRIYEGIPDLEGVKDTLYTEEDMADAISFVTYSDSDKLFSCSMIDQNFKETSYQNVSLKNHSENDPHSSELFRVITEAKYKGKELSRACQNLINKNKDKFRFEPCL